MDKIEFLKNAERSTAESREKRISEISSALRPRAQEAIRNCPARYRQAYAEVLDSSAVSRSNAIRMKCYECVGFENVRNMIGGCTTTQCPLWNMRPFKESDVDKSSDSNEVDPE